MTGAPPPQGLTLALHPIKAGFGWVAFEGPFSPYDWGLVRPHRDKNAVCLRRVEKLLGRFLPDALVLEVFEPPASARANRIAKLCRAIVALASDRGVEVAIYSRGDVRACFASVGAGTRQEIAEAVARHVDSFRHLLPRKRRPWDDEDRRMAIFVAGALVLTHFQLEATRLLNDLASSSNVAGD
jgi:Holliday junction resolvasome RuvABC endonuclease subunit